MLRRLTRIALWLGAVAALLGLLELVGVPVFEWIDDLLDQIGEVLSATPGGVGVTPLGTSSSRSPWSPGSSAGREASS